MVEFSFPNGLAMRLLLSRALQLLLLFPAVGLLAEESAWRVEFDDIVDSIPSPRVEFVEAGDTLRMPYLCNLDPGETHPGVNRVVYMVHGTLRNAVDYYADILVGARLAGVSAQTLLFAPQYLTEADLDSFQLDESHLFWEYMGWRQGNFSVSSAAHPRPWGLSAFAAADSILLRLADLLPDLETVVVAGHSAGGQFANRYATGSAAMQSLNALGIAVRFVATNPSTYLYFNEDRWLRGSDWIFQPPSAEQISFCPGYNDYKYGLDNPNEYMDQDIQVLRDRYEASEVIYFAGADDIQFNDEYLDKSCPALLQGQMRLQRMQIYAHYLIHFFGADIFNRHEVNIVQGVGHNHNQMFTSACGLHYLFDAEGCAPMDALMPWTELSPDIIQVSYANHGAWGDYDGDGFDDLYLAGNGPENRLIQNSGGFLFHDLSEWPLIDAGTGLGCSWVDHDGDADLDLYLVNDPELNKLFRNEGPAGFVSAAEPPEDLAEHCRDAAWADYDGDGDLDLYLTRGEGLSNLLLENEAGDFIDVTEAPLAGMGDSRDASWCDADLDGDPDLYVCNLGANVFLRNDGPAGFTELAAFPLDDAGDGYSASWGDFDGDGDPDLFVANAEGPDRLLRNEGACVFSDASELLPYAESGGRTAAWGDFDNDGWLDLYLGDYLGPNLLLRNQSGGGFEPVSFPLLDDPHPTVSASWADCDRDGDLDLYMGKTMRLNRILRNELDSGAHWLQVDLLGGGANRFGVGARIEAIAGGLRQSRQIGSDDGYLSQNTLTAEFGLDQALLVDTLRVWWPSGAVQETLQVAVDQRILLQEPGSTDTENAALPSGLVLDMPYPNPFNPSTRIAFTLPVECAVDLFVFDARGRRVRAILHRDRLEAGRHFVKWDGRGEDSSTLPSGVYFLALVLEGQPQRSRKLILLK